MSGAEPDNGFLSRWSRRKAQARRGVAAEEPSVPSVAAVPAGHTPTTTPTMAPAATPTVDADASPAPMPAAAAPPLPTLTDVATLTRESDYSRFVAPGVEGAVKNAALKKLFSDPHFNVMDGLDIYIDDYTIPSPLPLATIRQMSQAAFLGLAEAPPVDAPTASTGAAATPAAGALAAAEPAPAAVAPAPDTPTEPDAVARTAAATTEPDEDADLRLQSHDAAGRGGAEGGAAAHERRQC